MPHSAPENSSIPRGLQISVLVSILLVTAAFSVTQIADYDFWWHANLGRSIWTAMTPWVNDSFSYTFYGMPQYNGEWLADLSWFAAISLGGYYGVAFLKAILLCATVYLLWRAAIAWHSEIEPASVETVFALGLTFLLVAFSIRFRMFPRPVLFSYLFISAFFLILALYERDRNPKYLFWLPFIELLWPNFSKGAFYGPLLLILLCISTIIKRRPCRQLLVVLALVSGVSLLNPNGYTLYSDLFSFASGGIERMAVVGEHKPLSPELLWGYGLRYTWAFQIMVLLSIFYLFILKGFKNLFLLFIYCAFLIQSILMVRMIDFFSIAASLLTFPAVTYLFSKLGINRLPLKTSWLAVFFILAAGIGAVASSSTYSPGVTPKKSHIPQDALTFLDREKISGRLFNSHPFGGYIPWAAPLRTVFIDGRINQLYPPPFNKQYQKIIHNRSDWQQAEVQWGFDHALLEYDLKSIGLHFPKHLADNPAWALVYWDSHSAVYLKRIPRNEPVIQRSAYLLARPAFNDFSYLDPYLKDPKIAKEALRLIEHDIALNPDNQEPRLARVFLLYYTKDLTLKTEMMNELLRCRVMLPDIAMEHSAMGLLYFEKGDMEGARREALQALKLDPSDDAARHLGKKLGMPLEALPK